MSTFAVGSRVQMRVQVQAFASDRGVVARYDPVTNPLYPWQVRPDGWPKEYPGLWFAERELEPEQGPMLPAKPVLFAHITVLAADGLVLIIAVLRLWPPIVFVIGFALWLAGMVWLSCRISGQRSGQHSAPGTAASRKARTP